MEKTEESTGASSKRKPEHKGSYKASEVHPDVQKEIDRLRAQAMWGWEKESRNLKLFGLGENMSILEVGSGPGFVTEQLLSISPGSHVTCIEIDPELIDRAERYLHDKVPGRYTIVEGDLMNMDLPDNTFDFAYARYVFQHLPDPLGAMLEIKRVLKPGGKLAIFDVDSGLLPIVDPPDPKADALDAKINSLQNARGGNRAIGRRLWRLLAEAGYTNMDLEGHFIHSDRVPLDTIFPQEWDPRGLEPALREGFITEEDVEALHESHIAFWASPDKYVLFTVMMACGEKPAAS